MNTLYLECNAGASGDMILGALADLLEDPAEVKRLIEGIGIPGISCSVETAEKNMITGTRVTITVDGVDEGDVGKVRDHHPHHHLGDVLEIIHGLNVPKEVIDNATAVYQTIAAAESDVHGKPVNEVHFHEVGALDAIADVVGVCLLMHKLAPSVVIASPLRLGYGEVACAHGILPVPAPATAHIIRGMKTYSGDKEGEFTTPTGAALIKQFASSYGPMPEMAVKDCGYGIGKKDMPIANVLRAFVGS